MSDPTAKYIVLALVPIMITIILVLLAYLAVRFEIKAVFDFINRTFWGLKYCFVYGVSKGQVLGERLFINPLSLYYVNVYLLYGAANSAGLLITLWWRIILWDISTDNKCKADMDCFKSKSSTVIGFPSYYPCNETDITPADMTIFCVRFAIPTIQDILIRVGVAYGFTVIVFAVIHFITRFNLGQNGNRIVSIVGVVLIVLILILMILLIALVKSFTAWLQQSLINYIIPFMIVICILVAFGLFGLLNRQLTIIGDQFFDADAVHYIRDKE